jgi:hypothetical protein
MSAIKMSERSDKALNNQSLGSRAKQGQAGKTSVHGVPLVVVPIVLRMPIRCRQLVHEVHPNLFVIPRPMHWQGGDLRMSVLLLMMISVMWILWPMTDERQKPQ